MIYDYNELYRFNTKLITSLKTKNIKLSRSDFMKLKTSAPDSYDLAYSCYRLNNADKYSDKIKSALDKDIEFFEKYNITAINPININSHKHKLTSSVINNISNKSMFLLDKIKRSLKNLVIIPTTSIIGISTAVTMIGYSNYITNKNHKLLNINELSLEQIIENTMVLNEDEIDSQIILDESIALSGAGLAVLGMIYMKAAISYSFGVENKRKSEILKTALPGSTSMFMLPMLLAMCATSL